MTEPLKPGKPNPKAKLSKGPKALNKAIQQAAAQELGERDPLDIPPELDRKKNGVTPATAEERAEFAKRSTPEPDVAAAPDPVVAEIDAAQEQNKKAKASNRIARLANKKAVADIPEKYRAWDTDRSVFYDTRKGKPKESIMSAVAKKKPVTTAKPKHKPASTRRAPSTPKVAGKQKRDATTIDALVKLATRPKGVTRKEMIEASGMENAGFNTILQKAGESRGLKLKIDKSEGIGKYRYLLVK